MVVIPPVDTQGEAVWRLVTGAAQDSWEAICKYSHPQSEPSSTIPELRPRRGGGSIGGDKHYERRAESVHGNSHSDNSNSNSNSNSNNNDSNDDNDSNDNNIGTSEKTTAADTDMTTAAAAADPTTAAEAVPLTTITATADAAAIATSLTAAAAAATSQAAEMTVAEIIASAISAAAYTTTSSVAAAAAITTADAVTPSVANDSNDINGTAATAAAAATETAAAAAPDTTAIAATDTPAAAISVATAADTAAAQVQVATDSAVAATETVAETITTTAIAAATQTTGADAGSETTYATSDGQATTSHIAATTTAGVTTGTLGTAAATGTVASTVASSSHASNIGVIIGAVVGAIILLAVGFVLYRFRRSKYLKALFCCCGGLGGDRNDSSTKDGGSGYDHSDGPTSTRHMADSSARLVGQNSADSLLTPTSASALVPASDMGMGRDRDERRGYSNMPEKTGYYGSNSRAAIYDEKRAMVFSARNGARDLTLPPSVSMTAIPNSPTSPIMTASSVSSASSSAASAAPAALPALAAAPAHKPAHRQRSPSYSTFPAATRAHNYSNSITRVSTAAPLTPPSTAVHQKKNSVPRVAVQAAAADLPASYAVSLPFAEPPMQRMSGPARSSLTLTATPEGLVPPPRNLSTRQRQSSASHDDTDADDSASLAPTFNRSSYTESIGGDSIASSVLMSPSLLQWPVPPNTPPVSHFGPDAARALGASNLNLSSKPVMASARSKSQESNESGSTDTNSQGSGPFFDRVAIVPSHVPTVTCAGNLPVPRRPLTTVSSASSPTTQGQAQAQDQAPPMPSRGPMPTRASLSGPSSRNLMQMQSARRQSVVSNGSASVSSHGNGSGSIVHAVPGPPPTHAPPPTYGYSQKSPRGPPPPGSSPGLPTYQQQQYPRPQRLPPTGYTPPHASAVTVHHTGQATSVRVPISRSSQQRHNLSGSGML